MKQVPEPNLLRKSSNIITLSKETTLLHEILKLIINLGEAGSKTCTNLELRRSNSTEVEKKQFLT